MTGLDWDVIVVGGGPSGLNAAIEATSRGARTVVLERAVYPRYKTCGGGIVGASEATLPDGMVIPNRNAVDKITFTCRNRWSYTKCSATGSILKMVDRQEFDHTLFEFAVKTGVTVLQETVVRSVDHSPDGRASVHLKTGQILTSQVVIGADGSSGVVAKFVGAKYEQVDLGLEYEIPVGPELARQWRGRALLDWGPIPGSYAWIFPKDDHLTVGVIASRGRGEETKEYLRQFVSRHGLEGIEPARDSGHLTRCRSEDSPLAKGRVLLVGDAAGLLEPWTREGISYALRSGRLAGEVAAKAVETNDYTRLARYEERIRASLGSEIAAGRLLFLAFTRIPFPVHVALFLPKGWRIFRRICRSEYTYSRALSHRFVRVVVQILASPKFRWRSRVTAQRV